MPLALGGATRHVVRIATRLTLACLCASAPPCFPQDNDINPLGAAATVPNEPLQELLSARRPKGPVYLSIPRAFGIATAQPDGKAACVPQILATNTSNQTLELLMVGIRYRKPNGQEAGSAVLRFDIVKVGKEELNRFANPVAVQACAGVTADVEILRCMYDTGDSCLHDVKAVGYGAIPLTLKDGK
jgi:hypothetical protein